MPDSILRVVNNDTYEEVPHVFNRLAPATFAKNKVSFDASFDQRLIVLVDSIEWLHVRGGRNVDGPTVAQWSLSTAVDYFLHTTARNPHGADGIHILHQGDLRLLHSEQRTSDLQVSAWLHSHLPFNPSRFRYRVIVADDVNQTGRGFHPASIRFQTSKPDVLMRLAVLDGREEILRVEGKGCVVVPSVLFMRDVTNAVQPPPPPPPAAPTTSQRQQSPTKSSTKAGAGLYRCTCRLFHSRAV